MRRVLVLLALVSAPLGCVVQPTNPFDPETPAVLQEGATLRGRAAFPLRAGAGEAPAGGIVVQLVASDGPVGTPVVTTDESDGAFEFAELEPGTYLVSVSAEGFRDNASTPANLFAGAELDVGLVRLLEPFSDARLAGEIAVSGGLNPDGANVRLLRATDDDECGAEVARTTSRDGGYVFDPIPPGRFRVAADTPGATVAVSDVFEVSASGDVEGPTLSMRPGSLVVRLEADGDDDASTTRADEVLVHIEDLGLDEMQLATSPTFDPSSGATGWVPWTPTTLFTLPPPEGRKDVFVQLRSSCVESPLYSDAILYDVTPPLLLSARVQGLEGVGADEPPLVVVGDTRELVGVSLTVDDLSGLAEAIFETTALGEQRVSAETEGGTPALLRVDASLPPGEGFSDLVVRLRDRAGNETPSTADDPNADQVRFRVLRDLSPPLDPGRHRRGDDRREPLCAGVARGAALRQRREPVRVREQSPRRIRVPASRRPDPARLSSGRRSAV